MADTRLPEVWMRGPLAEVPALLQPVAHALLQAQEELHALLNDLPEAKLWERPADVASVGFHLQHLSGVLDRLFTYARGEMLSAEQLAYLSAEGKEDAAIQVSGLLAAFDQQLARCMEQLKTTDSHTLTEVRTVGRKKLPSTVMGLLFHAAEHTMRHIGQLLVTIKVIRKGAV
jgi:uncharacterized damage-inducible protein DinB